MTGLLIMSLGSSLRNASQIAGRMIVGSNKERTFRRGLSLVFIDSTSRSPERVHVKHFCLFLACFRTKSFVHPAPALVRGGQKRLPARIARCSAIGPSARAGK